MPFESEFSFLVSALPEIEPYLLSEELFWPVPGSPPGGQPAYPRLTLGSLLLAVRKAAAYAETPALQARLTQAEGKIDWVRTKWRTKWEGKSHREMISRLNQWRNYLMEFRQAPERQADFYPQEVRWRVMAELLAKEVDDLTEVDEEFINGLDNLVRGILIPGEFVWSAELRPSFPPSPYWYLYGSPRVGDQPNSGS